MRTYVTVNLDTFGNNIQNIISHIGNESALIAVIKTDGYGHGAVRLAMELESYSSVWGYAVATVEEAIELRNAGISKRILILGYIFPSDYKDLIRHHITPTIFDAESAEELSKAAGEQNLVIPVHIKVDTGMSRIGMSADHEGLMLIKRIISLKSLSIEGIFTHLARADEYDTSSALDQIALFNEFNCRLKEEGINIPLRHCANSAGIITLKEAGMELMRAGIILYGLRPSDQVRQDIVPIKPILEWKSTVSYVKTLDKGVPISYGGTYITSKVTVVATIPTGYGDGYPRQLSNKGFVLIHGKRAPIIGRVCMDQFMVDVTGIEGVKRGDTVTLIGRDGDEQISMEEVASLCSTINYEIACGINKRVPRIYLKK